jgi:hypothetical protein
MTVAELNWKWPAGVLRASIFGGSRTDKAPTDKAPTGKASTGTAQQRVRPGYTSFRPDAKSHLRSRRRRAVCLGTNLAYEPLRQARHKAEREAVVEALVRTRTNISQASPGREAPIPLSVH